MSDLPNNQEIPAARHSLVASTVGFLLTICIPISSIRLWGQSLIWITILFLAMLIIGHQTRNATFNSFYAGYWRGLSVGYILAVMYILRVRTLAGLPQ